MPTQTPPVNVLTFHPACRRSSRRIAAEAQAAKDSARRVKRYETAYRAQLARDAKALGVTPSYLEDHDDIRCHCDEILRIEAAYRRSTRAGRLAQVKEIQESFARGHDVALDDVKAGLFG